MPCVRYKVQGAAGSEGSFQVPGSQLTLADIKRLWPFDGAFHFRAKVPDESTGFAWLDVVDDADAVPLSGPDEAVVKAVFLEQLPCFGDAPPNADAGAGEDGVGALGAGLAGAAVDEHLSRVADAVEAEYDERCAVAAAMNPPFNLAAAPVPRQPGSTSGTAAGSGAGAGAGAGAGSAAFDGAPGVARASDVARAAAVVGSAATAATLATAAAAASVASDAKKSMGKIFRAGRFLARAGMHAVMGNVAPVGKPPSVDALVNVQDMQIHLNTHFAPEFPPHEQLLERLWKAAYPGKPLVRVSPKWQRLGFQQPDPGTDFRGGGVLSLKCCVYMAETYNAPFTRMISDQASQRTSQFPVAAAAINVATMLATLAHLDNPDVGTVRAPFWGVFTQYNAFFELFCMALRLFARLWAEQQASIEDFHAVLATTREKMQALLAQGPETLDAAMDLAMKGGLLG